MQPHRRRILYIGILVLGLIWIAISAKDDLGAERSIAAPQKGFSAPDFSLQTLNGTEVRLSELRGRVVVINFWASWCPPCKAEMPAMQRVHAEYESQGVTILAVNSTVQDSAQAAAAFAVQNGLTFPILLDTTGETTRLYAIRSLPSTFFVRRDGSIGEVVIGGPISEALLRTRIQNLLKEKP